MILIIMIINFPLLSVSLCRSAVLLHLSVTETRTLPAGGAQQPSRRQQRVQRGETGVPARL